MSKGKEAVIKRTEREKEEWCEKVCNLSEGQRKGCKVQQPCPKEKKEGNN